MTILQFVLFELTVLLGLKLYNVSGKGGLFFMFGYPIWLLISFLACLELINYHPDYPRFNGFMPITDWLLLFFMWGIGFIVIPVISTVTHFAIKSVSKSTAKKLFTTSLIVFILFSLWGWAGLFSTPTIKNKLFIKSNPTFKVLFETKFLPSVTWGEREKLIKNEKDLQEEIKFIQYVRKNNL